MLAVITDCLLVYTYVGVRFSSSFSAKDVVYGCCTATLPLTVNEASKQLAQLLIWNSTRNHFSGDNVATGVASLFSMHDVVAADDEGRYGSRQGASEGSGQDVVIAVVVDADNDYNDDDNGKYRSSLVDITDREEAKETSWKQNKNRQTKKHFI